MKPRGSAWLKGGIVCLLLQFFIAQTDAARGSGVDQEAELLRLARAARLVGHVNTVRGPLVPQALGRTLMHEHLFADWFEGMPRPARDDQVAPEIIRRMQQAGWPVPRSGHERIFFNLPDITLPMVDELRHDRRLRTNYVIDNEDVVAKEVGAFQAVGGETVVDQTSYGLGRDTARLSRFSARTGINVVAGTGWYRRPFHPKGLERLTVEELSRAMVLDVVRGDANGVRAGIIGEIPVDSRSIRINGPSSLVLPDAEVNARSSAVRRRLDGLNPSARNEIPVQEIYDPEELKVLRAAARASRISGAALSIHATDAWLGYLRIVEGEAADLRRVIVSHAHPILAEPQLLEEALRLGVVLEADYFLQYYPTRAPVGDLEPILDGIANAVRTGHRDQILLSLDICNKLGLRRYGGGGYATLQNYIIPELRARGVSDDDIDHIMIENPRRLLTLASPREKGTRSAGRP